MNSKRALRFTLSYKQCINKGQNSHILSCTVHKSILLMIDGNCETKKIFK